MTLKPVNQTCCTAHSQSNCKSVNKNEPCGARFGTAIAAVPDLNLDGFNDIVIGSPLENDHRGAVYIYHGSQKSIKEKYVQVKDHQVVFKIFEAKDPLLGRKDPCLKQLYFNMETVTYSCI